MSKGKSNAIYEELIIKMIISARYMVAKYHLNLGPLDTLEALINKVFKVSNGILKTSDTRENILAFLVLQLGGALVSL